MLYFVITIKAGSKLGGGRFFRVGRRVIGSVALLAWGIVLSAILAELGLCLAFFHSRDFSIQMWKYAVKLKRRVADPHLSFTHVPNGEAFLMGVDLMINSQ